MNECRPLTPALSESTFPHANALDEELRTMYSNVVETRDFGVVVAPEDLQEIEDAFGRNNGK